MPENPMSRFDAIVYGRILGLCQAASLLRRVAHRPMPALPADPSEALRLAAEEMLKKAADLGMDEAARRFLAEAHIITDGPMSMTSMRFCGCSRTWCPKHPSGEFPPEETDAR